jgi:hypothetical protein
MRHAACGIKSEAIVFFWGAWMFGYLEEIQIGSGGCLNLQKICAVYC